MTEFNEIYSEGNGDAELVIGRENLDGKLVIKGHYTDTSRRTPQERLASMITLDGDEMVLRMGHRQMKLATIDLDNIAIDASGPRITLGGNSGRGEGKLQLKNKLGTNVVDLNAAAGTASIGARGTDGRLSAKNRRGVESALLEGRHGKLTLGSSGSGSNPGINGRLVLRNSDGTVTAHLVGEHGNLALGGEGADGDISIRSSTGEVSITLDGNDGKIVAGGVGTNGDIIVKNRFDVETIRITGSDGDIRFLQADFAEEFSVKAAEIGIAEPGTVMSLSDDSSLMVSRKQYDTNVVGVIAGAGAYKPALILDQTGGENRLPVAMVGKIHCKVSAEAAPVRVGDLLTTSRRPGHAMRVSDRLRALGAVIGKALAPLDSGTGLIPVLVNLQ